MECGGDMNNLPAIMFQNNKTKQMPEADRWDDKQVNGDDAAGMVPQKGEHPCEGGCIPRTM